MGKIERLEKEIRELSSEDLSELRSWFAQFDEEVWDRQFEADVKAGKLTRSMEESMTEHEAGKSLPL